MDRLPSVVLACVADWFALAEAARAAATCRALRDALGGVLQREREAREALRRGFAPALDLDAPEARAACAACGLPGHRPYAELLGRCAGPSPLALVEQSNVLEYPLDGLCTSAVHGRTVREERGAVLRPGVTVRVSAALDPGVSVRFVGTTGPVNVERPWSRSVEWCLLRAGPAPCACPDRTCVWTLVVGGTVPGVAKDAVWRARADGLCVGWWRVQHERALWAFRHNRALYSQTVPR